MSILKINDKFLAFIFNNSVKVSNPASGQFYINFIYSIPKYFNKSYQENSAKILF